MTEQEKKQLSEIDICDLFITPAIKAAGWDQLRQIRREVTLTPGPVVVRGNMSSRNKKKKKFAPPQTRPDRRPDKKSLNKQIPISISSVGQTGVCRAFSAVGS